MSMMLFRFLALVALCLTACDRPAHKPNSTLRLNMGSDPMSMDPGIGGERRSQIVHTLLYDQLMRFDAEGQLGAAVAESVEVSEDFRHYIFHLRESQWTDGQAVTAQDFVDAWMRVVAPNSQSLYAYAFYPIKNAQAIKMGRCDPGSFGARAIDARTLEVELEFTAPYFLELTANPVYSPNRGLGPELTNGPFALVSYQHGREISLERNSSYWDVENVSLSGVEISFVNDAQTSLARFELDQLDFCGAPFETIALSALPALKERGLLQSSPAGGLFWYEFNATKAPFDNPKVRQAFSLAIDRQALVEHVLFGLAEEAKTIVPKSFGLVSEDRTMFDPVRARALLSEVLRETEEELPAITLSYGDLEGHRSFAQVVQAQWLENLGVEVSLQGMEWQVFLDSLFQRNYDVGGCYWFSWYQDPIYNLQAFKDPDGRMNGAGWGNPEYTRLIEESDRTLDATHRWKLLQEAESVLMDELPLTPVFEMSYQYLQSPKLHGVVISDLGQIDFKWARFE